MLQYSALLPSRAPPELGAPDISEGENLGHGRFGFRLLPNKHNSEDIEPYPAGLFSP